jgi:hypothetical protein
LYDKSTMTVRTWLIDWLKVTLLFSNVCRF